MIEAYLTAHILKRLCRRLILYLAGSVKDRDDTFRARHRLLHVFQQIGYSRDRSVEQAQVQKKRYNIGHAQTFPIREISAEPNHEYCSE